MLSIKWNIRNHSDEPWPRDLYEQIDRLVQRHRELEPLIRPEQQDPEPDQFPPEMDHRKLTDDAALSFSSQVEASFNSAISDDVLDERAETAKEFFVDSIREAIAEDDPSEKGREKKFSMLYRGVLGLIGLVGTVLTAVASGVTTNVLTAPAAGQLFQEKLQALIDFALKFF